MTDECEYCKRSGGRYDFGRTCCRVRFILSLPTRELRAGWIERWRAKNRAFADKVEAEVRARWVQRKADQSLPTDASLRLPCAEER